MGAHNKSKNLYFFHLVIVVLSLIFTWKFIEALLRWQGGAIGTVLTYEETSHRKMPSITVYKQYTDFSIISLEGETVDKVLPRAGISNNWKHGQVISIFSVVSKI